MSGVAGQEHPATPVLRGDARGVGEAADPAALSVVDGLTGEPLPRVGEFPVAQRVAVLRAHAPLVHDDAGYTVLQVHRHDHAAAGQVLADAPAAGVDPGDVGGVEPAGGFRAGEVDAGEPADGAASAVAAHQVPSGLPAAALRAVEGDDDAVRALLEARDLVSAAHRHPEFGHPAFQHPLGAELGDSPEAGVILRQQAEVEGHATEVAVRRLRRAQPAQQPTLVEALGRTPGEAGAARLRRPLGQLLVDDDIGSAEAQFAGHHQADGAGPDHDHVPGHRAAPIRPASTVPNQWVRVSVRVSVLPGEVQAT